MIRRDELSQPELRNIATKYDGYHLYTEFWHGFDDYQTDRKCRYSNNSAAGQAWDRGAEAAMNIIRDRYKNMERFHGAQD